MNSFSKVVFATLAIAGACISCQDTTRTAWDSSDATEVPGDSANPPIAPWKSFPKHSICDIIVVGQGPQATLYASSSSMLFARRGDEHEWRTIPLEGPQWWASNHRFFQTSGGDVVLYTAEAFGLRKLNQFTLDGKLTGSFDLKPIASEAGEFEQVIPYQGVGSASLVYFVFGPFGHGVFEVDAVQGTSRRLVGVPSPSGSDAMATRSLRSSHHQSANTYYASGRKLVQFDCEARTCRIYAVDEPITYISSVQQLYSEGPDLHLLCACTINGVIAYREFVLPPQLDGNTTLASRPFDVTQWDRAPILGSVVRTDVDSAFLVRFSKNLVQSGVAGASGMSHGLRVLDLNRNLSHRVGLDVRSRISSYFTEVIISADDFLQDGAAHDIMLNCGDSVYLVDLDAPSGPA